MTDEEATYNRKSPKFSLTAKGNVVAAALRAHKASGGSFATFVLPDE